jgi:hypothetical protein
MVHVLCWLIAGCNLVLQLTYRAYRSAQVCNSLSAAPQGFAIYASCPSARLKLLLWDTNGPAEWNMSAQEDSVRIGSVNVAALYQVKHPPLEGVPRSVLVCRCCTA